MTGSGGSCCPREGACSRPTRFTLPRTFVRPCGGGEPSNPGVSSGCSTKLRGWARQGSGAAEEREVRLIDLGLRLEVKARDLRFGCLSSSLKPQTSSLKPFPSPASDVFPQASSLKTSVFPVRASAPTRTAHAPRCSATHAARCV